jgi:hypothetical protein
MALIAGQVPVSGYRIPDYSGAAAAGGAAGAAPYQVVSGLIGQVQDYFKQQGEEKKNIKVASSQIDAILKLMPELEPALSGIQSSLKDENIPISYRSAEASNVPNLINASLEMMMGREKLKLQRQELGIRQQAAASGNDYYTVGQGGLNNP